MSAPRPAPLPALAGLGAYGVPRSGALVDLRLDGNEGSAPAAELLDVVREAGPELLRRYPDARELEARLARRFRLDPEQVLVTAGADEALDRVCRAMLGPGRSLVLPSPTFVMIPHFARLAGATLVEVPWTRGSYPLREVLARVGPETAVIACVTPNNPTGLAARREELERLLAAAPHALVLVDHAYAEFAQEDLTEVALASPNALVLRTFSKAFGLAGLRVGYALGPVEIVRAMRAAGGPYSVSAPSLAIAARAMELPRAPVDAFVTRVRQERAELAELCGTLGAGAEPSQANFVLARFRDETWVQDALAGLGIAVRRFPGVAGLERALRITCPGEPTSFARLTHALRAALAPEALLFDVDGVLADVSGSYRRAILETAASFGASVTPGDVTAAKARGNANNDWELTRALLAERGVEAPLAEVTRRFEDLYQGTAARPGLRNHERLLPSAGLLERLAARLPLGVVTGRPRADLESFLERAGVRGLFRATACLEDGPPKPRPEPVLCALERLGVQRAWMIGDTPDDVRAARAAGVVPLGIRGPSDGPAMERALLEAGAARVLSEVRQLEELLP